MNTGLQMEQGNLTKKKKKLKEKPKLSEAMHDVSPARRWIADDHENESNNKRHQKSGEVHTFDFAHLRANQFSHHW